MFVMNFIAIVIILFNIAGLFFLLLIGIRNVTGKYKKDLSKIKIAPKKNYKSKIREKKVVENNIIENRDDLLDDLDLSDFDDLNLDDFD